MSKSYEVQVVVHSIGDEIQAHFNLSGRLWSGNGQNEKCFTSLQAWRISSPSGDTTSSQDNHGSYDDGSYDNMSAPLTEPPPAPPNDDYDDIPF